MQTPSPDKSTQPQRREPLRWMAAAALLLAFLSICCVAQVVTFLLAPRNQRSNLDLRSKLLADYAPWDIDLPLPAIGPQVPAAQAADLATATSIALLGTSTPVIVGALPTSELAIVPPVANAPTPTLPGVGTVPPAPTATPAIAGGGITRTPTRAPTSTPTESDATPRDTPRPTSPPTPTDTREPQNPTTAPTTAPTAEPTNTPTSPPDKPPTPRPTSAPPPDTPEPTTVPATDTPQPQATDTPKPTVKPTDKPDKTATPKPTVAPTITPTRAPTITPTRAPTPTNTPITPSPTASNTPVTPSPTPTDTPVTPSPTPTPTDTAVPPSPTPTVGTLVVIKSPSADPATTGAAFRYTIRITNNTGAQITITQIQDTADSLFSVLDCLSPQGGSCIAAIGPGAPSNWTGPITLQDGEFMELWINGSFTGPSAQVCNTTFTVTTSAGPITRNNTACIPVN